MVAEKLFSYVLEGFEEDVGKDLIKLIPTLMSLFSHRDDRN